MTTRLLASVSNFREADLVARHGADIVDLKNPADGVLGAVDTVSIRTIVERLDHRCDAISATIGDLPADPSVIGAAIRRTAATGVDIVKVGWFAPVFDTGLLPVLRESAVQGIRIVVVLFAEHGLQLDYLPHLAAAGIHGVMLDTAVKHTGSLRDKLTDRDLAVFVATSRMHGMLCGLAGSLRQSDILPLRELQPDYLGFRGALCRAGQRTAALDGAAVESVRCLIKSSGTARACAS